MTPKRRPLNLANTITILRLPVLLAVGLLLYVPRAPWRLVAAPLIVILILMDTFDGYIARARHESSLLGSVLDIMADRTVELVLWICLADLGLISVVIPIVFVVRGTIVDALRSVHVSAGQRPFDSLQSPLGSFLVKSPWMRSGYAVVKCFAFAGLALVNALSLYAADGAVSLQLVASTHTVFRVLAWIATGFCLARGIPVVIEAMATLISAENHGEEPS